MGKEILRTNKYGIFNIVVYCLFHDSISSVKPGKHTRTHTFAHAPTHTATSPWQWSPSQQLWLKPWVPGLERIA